MKKNKISKRLCCLSLAIMLIVGACGPSYKAFAFDENGFSITIDTSTITLRDTWQQIKNAAIIHLVSQQMRNCTMNGHVLNGDDLSWAADEESLVGLGLIVLGRGVLEAGEVFTASDLLGGDFYNDIYVGPWYSSFFGEGDGEIECNDWMTKNNGNLFNAFVYVLKNYRAGFDLDINNLSVNRSDRLGVVCDGANPGLLKPYGDDSELACNDDNVKRYTGSGTDNQYEYLKRLYESFRATSGNSYIIPWDNLYLYDEVDGYYLYSKDFEVQCTKALGNVSNVPSDNSVKWYYVDNDSGKVSIRYFQKDDLTNKAYSFVGGPDGEFKRSCEDLVNRMNELIGTYIQTINLEIGRTCKAGIDEAIEEKKKEIDEKYLQSASASDMEKSDAQLVLDEYDRIITDGEYVARVRASMDETEVLESFSAAPLDFVGPVIVNLPTEYIWTCRSHLPYINVEKQNESSLADALKNEFYDACYDSDISLPWLICPVINWVSDTVDELNKMLDGFF